MSRSILVIAALLALGAPALAQSSGFTSNSTTGTVAPNSEGPVINGPPRDFAPVFPMAADLPACNNAEVLWRVAGKFAGKESAYWASDLKINEVVDIKEIGLNSNGEDYIPRRYCVGMAKMSDNVVRPVVYQVQHSLGFASYTVGVESCVVGFDRNFAYAPDCSVLRPLVDRYAGDGVRLTYP